MFFKFRVNLISGLQIISSSLEVYNWLFGNGLKKTDCEQLNIDLNRTFVKYEFVSLLEKLKEMFNSITHNNFLTLSQTTNFRPFQTETVCSRQC